MEEKKKKENINCVLRFWSSSDSNEATRTAGAGLLWMEDRQENLWGASSQMPCEKQGTGETALVADVPVTNKCAREAQVITGC